MADLGVINTSSKFSNNMTDRFHQHQKSPFSSARMNEFRKFIEGQKSSDSVLSSRTLRTNEVIRRAIVVGKNVDTTSVTIDNTEINVEQKPNSIVITTQESTCTFNMCNFMLRFLGRHSLNPIELFGSKNPMKEMSEVGAAIYHTKVLQPKFGNKVCCYIIGEGKRPCISRIIQIMHPEWTVVTIDPILDPNFIQQANLPIQYHCCLDTEVDTSSYSNFDTILMIGVHSHNNMTDFWNRFQNISKFLINIPCCVEPSLDHPHESIVEHGILSTMKQIYIYQHLNEA